VIEKQKGQDQFYPLVQIMARLVGEALRVDGDGCGLGKKWPGCWVGPGAGGLRYLRDRKRIKHRDPCIEFLLISFN
jgi:hypothetical protein